MVWPELLCPRTHHSEVLICRDAGPAVLWLILCFHQTGKDHPCPSVGNASSEYLHVCPVLGHKTGFGLQACVLNSFCQLTALASMSDGFWAPGPIGVRLQSVIKQFQTFLEVLRT